MIHNEAGWHGSFTRAQADGAIPNGTAIVKAIHEEGDAHEIGSPGKVLGSIANPGDMPEQYGHIHFVYWVEWADRPRVACGIMDYKIKPAPEEEDPGQVKVNVLCQRITGASYISSDSLQKLCAECGCGISVTPATLQSAHEDGRTVRLLCAPCMVRLYPDPSALNFIMPSERQVEEFKEGIRNWQARRSGEQ